MAALKSILSSRVLKWMGTFWPADRGCSYWPVAPSSQHLCPWSRAHFEHQA